MGIFNSKYFNSEVFGKYVETVPRIKQNALLKSGVLRVRNDLKTMLTEQTGGNYISVPMTGRIGGDAQNYDGATNLSTTGIDTYLQSMIVVGRMKGWKERDFSYDITGKDFMKEIAAQVSEYWDDVDQLTLIKTLIGVFGVMDGAFSNKHTLDVTGTTTGKLDATTPNTAMQRASGANKNAYTLMIMHSAVSTNLENLEIIDFKKGTNENGMQDMPIIGRYNGRIVLIDDDVPTTVTETTAGVYSVTVTTKATAGDVINIDGVDFVAGTDFSLSTDSTTGNAAALATALNASTNPEISKYTWTSSSAKLIATEDSGNYGNGAFSASVTQAASGTLVIGAVTQETPSVTSTVYTTYLLGRNAIDYCNCGAKVPYETDRDPKTNGGEEMLYTRQRKLFAPHGFSFVQPSTPIISPTDAQLATAARWALVKNTAGTTYYDPKAIPIARILSKG